VVPSRRIELSQERWTSDTNHLVTRRHIPEEQRYQQYGYENLKTRKLGFISVDRAVYLFQANIIAVQLLRRHLSSNVVTSLQNMIVTSLKGQCTTVDVRTNYGKLRCWRH